MLAGTTPELFGATSKLAPANRDPAATAKDKLLRTQLMVRIEAHALSELSEQLADTSRAPIEVVRRLAHRDEIEVAGPVLARSARLTDQDLIEVAKVKGQEHLLAISRRAELHESVTDVLTIAATTT